MTAAAISIGTVAALWMAIRLSAENERLTLSVLSVLAERDQ